VGESDRIRPRSSIILVHEKRGLGAVTAYCMSKVEALLHGTICKIAATFSAVAVRVQGAADLLLRMQCTLHLTSLTSISMNDWDVTFLSIPLTVLD
jgi:hypothetical protein